MPVGVEASDALPSLKSAREDHGSETQRVDSVKAPSSSVLCGSAGHAEGVVIVNVRSVSDRAEEIERSKPSVKLVEKEQSVHVGNDLNDTTKRDS